MGKNEWKKLVGVAGRLVLAFVFVFSQTAWAGQDQKTTGKAASPRQGTGQQVDEKLSSAATTAKAQSNQAQGEESESPVAKEKSSGDGRREGIKVHGHWTIDVRNPDGTVATHREFENSLTSSGGAFLASLLANLNTPVGSPTTIWQVVAGNTQGATSSGPCAGTVCVINQSLTATPSPLTVASNAGILTLSGSIVVSDTSLVNTVTTGLFYFVGTQATNTTITQATLTNPISVSAGQTIAITVNISFS
jgi:hypothetical protein